MNNGKEVTASAKFTPETSEGSVDVTFTFDASDLDGHTFVAYEQMYDVKTGPGQLTVFMLTQRLLM